MEQEPFGSAEFAENPEPRVPCVLLLDISGSMAGRPIAELNEGLKTYQQELSQDPLAAKRVEVAIVAFGGEVQVAADFVTADKFIAPTLQPRGNTPMGTAIHRAIDMLDERKRIYRGNGIAYYRPWLFLITDGAPSDDWKLAAERLKQAEHNKSLAFFVVGVSGADFAVLGQLSARQPLQLKGMRFQQLFQWLSNSQKCVSRSAPGDEVKLSTPEGWAKL